MMMRLMFASVLLLLAGIDVHAASEHRITVSLIHAVNDFKGETDPKLKEIDRDLRKLFKFSSYWLSDSSSFTMSEGDSRKVKLGPNVVIDLNLNQVKSKVAHLDMVFFGKGNKIFESKVKVSNGNTVLIGSNYSGEGAWIVSIKVE